MRIPFNKLYMTGNELVYINEAHSKGHLVDLQPRDEVIYNALVHFRING